MDTPDLSTLSDSELLAKINGAAPSEEPAQPAAPVVDFAEVSRGLSQAELRRAASDDTFAQTLIDRHLNFTSRSAAGENPLDPDRPGDRALWEWQNRMAGKPSLLHVVKESVVGIANDLGNALGETTSIVADAASGDLTKAAQRATDLGTVATAKAVAFNDTLVRGAGRAVEGMAKNSVGAASAFMGPVALANPKLAKVMQQATADTEGREKLEELHAQHAFEAARANFREEKTAERIHKDLSLVYPALSGILGNTEVDQSAAAGLSMIPQMGVEMAIAKGAAVAGYGASSAQFKAATEALRVRSQAWAQAKAEQAAAISVGTAEDIATAGKAVAEIEADLAARSAKLAELSAKAEAEVTAMTDAAASRVAAATAAQKAGAAVSSLGKLAETLEQLPADLAAKIAPESEVIQTNLERGLRMASGAVVGGAVGAITDDTKFGALAGGMFGAAGFGKAGARAVVNTGRDLSRLGEIFAKGEATLPFHQNVRKARDISGFTRQAFAFMDNAVFNAGAKIAPGAVKGAASAGAFGAGLGALASPDDPVVGAVGMAAGGAAFGASIGFLGQWRTYASPAQLARERAGQTRVYRDLLAARPDEAAHFDKLDAQTREQIAHYSAVHPDLQIRYVDDPSGAPGKYDKADPTRVTINVSDSVKDPLADVLGHEISHYVENHELGGALVRQSIGDFEAGIPGEYTARDGAGEPIPAPDGTAWELNQEFKDRTAAYVERIKATGERAGWTPEQVAAEVARVSQPDYIAREIFAEQHLAYLNSPTYTRDIQGLRSPSDWILNSAFLKNALGKLGVVFKPDGEIVRSGILGDFSKSATFDNLMREYYRRRRSSAAGDVEFVGGTTFHDEKALTKDTGYVERYYDASGEILRDTAGKPIYDAEGRATVRNKALAEKDARGAAEAAVKQLDAAAGISPDARPGDPDLKPSGTPASPDVVQRRQNIDGRVVYSGRFLSPETLKAIVDSGKLNPVQLDNLRQINAELEAGFGAEWTHFYQAATKKGGGPRARSLAGRFRTDLVYGIQITNPGNILVQSVSLEVLHENAAKAVSRGEAKLWNNSIGDLLGDVKTYLKNAANGLPGDTGIGTDKKNFINNLLGLRVKAHGDVNPLHDITNQPKTIITSLRLDRINRLTPVAERNVPFSSETYKRVTQNLRPDAQTETPEFKKWFGDWQDPKAFTSRAVGPVSAVVELPPSSRQKDDMARRVFGLSDFEKLGPNQKKDVLAKLPNGDVKELRPLVVFHGTTKTFDTFESGRPTFDDMGFFGNVETNRHAIFFSDSPEQAASYVTDSNGRAEPGARTIPAYLDMKSPMRFDANTNFETLAEETGINYRWLRSHRNTWEMFDGPNGKEFVAGLKKAGYDGAIFEEDAIRPGVKTGNTYAVFDPTQIKSATGNRGTFDPANPDIRFRPDSAQVKDRGVSTATLFEKVEALPELGDSPRVVDVGRALAARSRQLKRIPYDSRTPAAKDAIATTLTDEIVHAFKQDKSAVGWYEHKIAEAMDILSEVHPEVKTDPDRGSLFKAITAITSNGQAVVSNFSRGDELYQGWKDTGRIDSSSNWGGQRKDSINEGLATLQSMLDERGVAETARFLNSKFTVRELKEFGFPVNGEAADHVVYGSAIFGPKVGGGFYPNLQGDFSPVTMDLWLMRTWNRVNGSYGVADAAGMSRALSALREAAAENPGAPEAAQIDRLSDRQLANWAEKQFTDWRTRRKFKDATPFDRPAKRYSEAKAGEQDAPRNSSERAWVREVFSEIDKKLAAGGHPTINNADKQALLWYYEKDLYSLFGVTDKKSQPADYADAARQVVESRRASANTRGRELAGDAGLVRPGEHARAEGEGEAGLRDDGSQVRPDAEPSIELTDTDSSDTLARSYEQLRPDGNPDWAGKTILKGKEPLVTEDGQLAFPQRRFRLPTKLTHFTRRPGLEVVDPKFMGTGGGKAGLSNFAMMKGENKSFYFVGNSKPKAEENVSTAFQFKHSVSFDASKLYDMNADPAGLWFHGNKVKSEAALKAAGYDGFFAETDEGRVFAALFYPLDLKTGKFVSRNPGDNVGNFGYDPNAGLPAESAASIAAKKNPGSVNTRYGSAGDRVSGNPADVKPAPAMIFVSPNTGELDFAAATGRLKGKEHTDFLNLVRSEVGADAHVESAIGDWVDGAEDTVAVSFNGPKTFAETKRIAAKLGLAGQQKGVLHVIADPNGPDTLNKVTFPAGVTLARARKAMMSAGLEFRTLAPRDGQVVGYVFDQGRKLIPQLLDLISHATKPEIKTTAARGEMLGSWSSREEGAAIFNQVLAGKD